MKPIHSALVAAALLGPASLEAQRPAGSAPVPTTPTTRDAVQHASGVHVPIRVGRAGAVVSVRAPVIGGQGTRLSLQPRWMGHACPGGGPGGGCLVAQGSARVAPALTVQLGDGPVRPSRLGEKPAAGAGTQPSGSAMTGVSAGLLLSHGQPHTLRLSLDGSEVMGFSCNGRTIRLQAPGGAGFRWAVHHGGQRVDGGTSAGKPVDVASPVHGAPGTPMQLAVQQRDPAQLAGADDAWCKKYGCLELVVAHGDHRIVVTPALAREAPFAMRQLGVSVAGVPAFALTGVEVGGGAP